MQPVERGVEDGTQDQGQRRTDKQTEEQRRRQRAPEDVGKEGDEAQAGGGGAHHHRARAGFTQYDFDSALEVLNQLAEKLKITLKGDNHVEPTT